ncbi:MAG TPA: hypothetical protein VM802_07880 [Chitinophaga sp.]|uniref:hypothetical protein n=1 Tax=Chitinophaga sp. TaxID=1869181 RepID=UPI002BEE8667|nr:hypothetical protein [Chitinophaga sp.]HVI44773.1 hypothetical protein [Chitinophaga sp.]
MSFQITYSRLATVNMLHAFYLDREDSIYFGLSPAEQQNRLSGLLMDNRYSLMEELQVTPLPATERLMKGQHIVFRQMATGLLLGIASKLTGGILQPEIPVDGKLRLQFAIKLQHAALAIRSNIRLNTIFKGNYYFTNDGTVSGKTYPSLAAPLQPAVDKRLYEMGETALVNGVPSQAIQRTTSTASGWETINDFHCISEYDRILLPASFGFTFDQSGVTTATFRLLQNGQEVKTLSFSDATGLKEVQLNFAPVPNGVYTLTAAGNNYDRSYAIFINPQLYQPDAWGVLDLVMFTSDPAFRLIDNTGMLVTPAAPAFELRFASRATYWKYYLQKGEPPVADGNWDDVLPVPPGMKKVFISKQPYTLMQSYRKVSYAATDLPNPSGELLSRQENFICSEIMLPKLKL